MEYSVPATPTTMLRRNRKKKLVIGRKKFT